MSFQHFGSTDTICAISSPAGSGAIALIRISGNDAVSIVKKIFISNNSFPANFSSRKIYYGTIRFENKEIDQVVLCWFKAPNSYTGEDLIEISCHGSAFIQKKLMEILITCGARHAKPGEFTLRAFLNKKIDLSQAEAISDLIAATSESSHQLALEQMKGGFANKIKELRSKLVDLASLLELELDFSEEDVEFANRQELSALVSIIYYETEKLKNSFELGNVIKQGIPVAIIGKPNVGKSTLLNALLNEEKALVSDIPGTTRDSIEDQINIQGTLFRFIDTAGLRDSEDKVEIMGIERTYQKINQAQIILYVIDAATTHVDEIKADIEELRHHIENPEKRFIIVANKIDKLAQTPRHFNEWVELETIFVSAKRKENLQLITESLLKSAEKYNISEKVIISNIRHFEALSETCHSLEMVAQGISENLPTDLLAHHIRIALQQLGEITGEITTEEILGNIFGKFCIGK